MLSLSNLEFLVAEAWTGLKRNRAMAIAAIFTAAVSLAISAGFGLSALATYRACQLFPKDFDMAVYMKVKATDDQTKAAETAIRAFPHVTSVQFISKTEGWREFRKQLGTMISTEDVTSNPIPHMFRVKLDKPEASAKVQASIAKLDGIDEVDWNKTAVRLLNNLSKVISAAGILTMGILFAGSIFIIGNTIRLGIYARRREVAIMRMVGAKGSFIRLPFVMEGMLIAGLGAGLAIIMLKVAANYLGEATQGFQTLTRYFDSGIDPLQLYAILMGAGLLLGALASSMSVHKYLREASTEKGQR